MRKNKLPKGNTPLGLAPLLIKVRSRLLLRIAVASLKQVSPVTFRKSQVRKDFVPAHLRRRSNWTNRSRQNNRGQEEGFIPAPPVVSARGMTRNPPPLQYLCGHPHTEFSSIWLGFAALFLEEEDAKTRCGVPPPLECLLHGWNRGKRRLAVTKTSPKARRGQNPRRIDHCDSLV
jgi:hypothetical protein